MSTWVGTPLFKRFESKSTLLQLDDKQTRLDNRYKEIKETGIKIQDLVKVNIIIFIKIRISVDKKIFEFLLKGK